MDSGAVAMLIIGISLIIVGIIFIIFAFPKGEKKDGKCPDEILSAPAYIIKFYGGIGGCVIGAFMMMAAFGEKKR